MLSIETMQRHMAAQFPGLLGVQLVELTPERVVAQTQLILEAPASHQPEPAQHGTGAQ